jgi:hypothetical protein
VLAALQVSITPLFHHSIAQNGASARTCTSSLCLRTAVCMTLTPRKQSGRAPRIDFAALRLRRVALRAGSCRYRGMAVAPGNVDLRTTGSASSPCARMKKWASQPVPPRLRLFHKEKCCCYTMESIGLNDEARMTKGRWCGVASSFGILISSFP